MHHAVSQQLKASIQCAACATMVFLLIGCSTNGVAPVLDLTSIFSSPTFAAKPTVKGELPSFHIVEKGETLYSIAWNYGLDHINIAEQNGIDASFTIYPGQKVYLNDYNPPSSDISFDESSLQTAIAKALNIDPPKLDQQKVAHQALERPLTEVNKRRQSRLKTKNSIKNTRQTPPQSVNDKNGKVKNWLWPVNGRILERFSGVHGGNNGLDILADEGQAVRAAATGRVVYRGSALKGYGNLIIVKHNDDYLSAYAHNSKIHVQENEIVKAGQVIADIGSSGTDKSKLHFEIRYRGKPVDPIRYLPPL